MCKKMVQYIIRIRGVIWWARPASVDGELIIFIYERWWRSPEPRSITKVLKTRIIMIKYSIRLRVYIIKRIFYIRVIKKSRLYVAFVYIVVDTTRWKKEFRYRYFFVTSLVYYIFFFFCKSTVYSPRNRIID